MSDYIVFYLDGTTWESENEYGAPHRKGDETKIIHRLDGPAESYLYCGDYFENYYVEGERLNSEDFVKIFLPLKKEGLLPYLLNNDRGIRLLAEYRLRQFEETNCDI